MGDVLIENELILEDVKIALRITTDAFDGEINDLILAAKRDLVISGITNTDTEDPLIKRAITVYIKAHFGYDNPDSVKFQESYDLLKRHLALVGDYNAS